MSFAPRSIFSSRILAWTLLTLISCVSLHGQASYTGQLSGEVTDTSGAVIAGAKINAESIQYKFADSIASAKGKRHAHHKR